MTSATIDTEETPSTSSKQASPPPNQPAPPKSPVATASSFMSSTASLPIGQTTAQSGRSYLQSLNIKPEKKLKSRADHASIFSNSETEKKGFVANLFAQNTKNEDKTKENKTKEAKKTWFSKLRRKTNDLMHQLLRKSKEKSGDMKWDDFVMVRETFHPTASQFTASTLVNERHGIYLCTQYGRI
jgi:hypothetical protein